GHLGFVEGYPVVLGRDEQGLFALSSICTHWGCDMRKDGKATPEGVRCDCHGSHISCRHRAGGRALEERTAGHASRDRHGPDRSAALRGELQQLTATELRSLAHALHRTPRRVLHSPGGGTVRG